MNSVQFDYSAPRYLFGKLAGKAAKSFYWHRWLSCVRWRRMDIPRLPNSDWVRIKVKYGGICGSDVNLILLKDSPATSPFVSFPFTIGHELVGTVDEAGVTVDNVRPGDRVVVDPLLSCAARGIDDLCPHCQRGDYHLCHSMSGGGIAPGLLIGACRDTGGSWSEYLVAHKSQVLTLPDNVSDLNGVLVEPFSCALHAVLRNPPQNGDTVLVIGAGTIGICVVAAIRALELPCRVVVLAKHPFQCELASRYKADDVIRLTNKAQYIYETAETLGARALQPLFGDPVVQGGADLVFECVGTKQSINDALRFARNGGRIVLLGLAGILRSIDCTTVWLNELNVKGSFAYGVDEYEGRKRRTLQIAIDLMQKGKVDLSPLITHRFPLENYQEALRTVIYKGKGPVIKAVFEP
ncbi:alcohol dehydrogenase [Geobacillus sp. 46C-IIa]|uniref:zinc-dependent alcohol dehydrogenase n=1 Tax=Geobacillus sp. 46C-IIa TaxID=1963025 RepID=UPI0009BFBB77|nr:zinc-binding dehydrogenase [Geobacillus sp. 46C-IIa]OQP07676.1 alcohol dehydrogenase [Geobacillus sp. 46C-IIa]QNU29610.1 alcohol dehydrogenase catalytic domain-containing protein [Geobacillus sp. 46C-IIa]